VKPPRTDYEPKPFENLSNPRLLRLFEAVNENVLHLYDLASEAPGGIFTELPTRNLFVGRRIVYSAPSGLWDLFYDGEGEYPWKKIGGPPLRAKDAAGERLAKTGEGFLTTGAPSITVPLKMEFDAAFGTRFLAFSTGGFATLGLFVNGVEKDWAKATNQEAGGENEDAFPLRNDALNLTVEAGKAIALRYKAEFSNDTFYQMYLEVDPIRVG